MRRAGFTLIELIIAITLVSALVAGMLMSMRGGLLTLERTDSKIQESRAALGLDQMIRRQIGGIFPAAGDCAITQDQVSRGPVFRGTSQAMLLVTSYSIMEGSRGYPRLVEYRVVPNNDGALSLIVEEMLFPSPETTIPYCAPPSILRPLGPAARTMVLVPRLAAAMISYRQTDPATRLGGPWLTEWNQLNLPLTIRIDMQNSAGSRSTIAIPLHITREARELYADRR